MKKTKKIVSVIASAVIAASAMCVSASAAGVYGENLLNNPDASNGLKGWKDPDKVWVTADKYKEAEAYDGPSIIIAYSSCIAHGAPLESSFTQQKNAVESGMWMLYRYNPSLRSEGKSPLQIDSKEPKLDLLETYLYAENRYILVKKQNPELAAKAVEGLKDFLTRRWKKYKMIQENLI